MDVFQLQASVTIDTTEAASKLDALIEKADKLNDKLSEKKTVESPEEKGGSPTADKNTDSSNNSGSSDKSNTSDSTKSKLEEATEEAKKETFWDVVKNKGKEIGKSALEFASLYGGEIFAGAAFLAGGMMAYERVKATEAERAAALGSFDFDEEQQTAAMNYYRNMHNMAPSAVDEGFTIADTAYWDLEDAVGEELASAFEKALSLYGFDEGYDSGDVKVTDLFANPVDTDIPVELDAENGAEEIQSQVGTVDIPATVTVTGLNGFVGKGLNLPSIASALGGSHAKGLSYAPYDGYIAELHRGEEIITREQSDVNRNRGTSTNTNNNLYVQNMNMSGDADADMLMAKMASMSRSSRYGRGS